jgi:hypothetical protein
VDPESVRREKPRSRTVERRIRDRDPEGRTRKGRVDTARQERLVRSEIDQRLPAFIRQVVARSVTQAVEEALGALEQELDFSVRVRRDRTAARRGLRRMRNVSEFLRRRMERVAKRAGDPPRQEAQSIDAVQSQLPSKGVTAKSSTRLKKGKGLVSKSLDTFTAEADESGSKRARRQRTERRDGKEMGGRSKKEGRRLLARRHLSRRTAAFPLE